VVDGRDDPRNQSRSNACLVATLEDSATDHNQHKVISQGDVLADRRRRIDRLAGRKRLFANAASDGSALAE
jgi:hypothetical protein